MGRSVACALDEPGVMQPRDTLHPQKPLQAGRSEDTIVLANALCPPFDNPSFESRIQWTEDIQAEHTVHVLLALAEGYSRSRAMLYYKGAM